MCVCVCVMERKAKCIVLFLSKRMLFLFVPLFRFRKYLEMYFADSVKKIYNFVDKAVNGEDLMMNAIVSNYTSQFKFSLPCHALVVDVQRREIAKDGEHAAQSSQYCFMLTDIVCEMVMHNELIALQTVSIQTSCMPSTVQEILASINLDCYILHIVYVQIFEAHNFCELLFPSISRKQILRIKSFEYMVF